MSYAMAKKLFYEAPYEKEFNARVVEVDVNNVILDATLFYPTGGGQEHDAGAINNFDVIDVQETDGKIIHVLKSHNLKAGDEIHGAIDWERRYKLMRTHSALHVLYFIFAKFYGETKVIGSNVAVDKGRMDFAVDANVNEKLKEIEDAVNKFLSEEHFITMEEQDESRFWKCEQWRMPCGGTHVKNTLEIGRVKLKRKNVGKGSERIEVQLIG